MDDAMIRPGVAVLAGLLVVAAIASIAVSLSRLDGTAAPQQQARPDPVLEVTRQSEFQATVPSAPPIPAQAAAPPAGDPAPVAAARPTPVEAVPPEWDGRGFPTREWVEHWISQWFAEHRPDVELSPRDLAYAVDYAIELDAINQELAPLRATNEDPDRVAALEERAQRASERLLTITVIGGAEIPRVY